MVDWKVSAGAIVIALGSIFLGHFLTKSRESSKLLAAEIAAFKESLLPLIAALEGENTTPAAVITQHYQNNENAARKLEIHLPKQKRKAFTRCWAEYADLHSQKKALGSCAVIATVVNDLSMANVGTKEGIQYIYEQTSRRKKEALSLIQKITDTL